MRSLWVTAEMRERVDDKYWEGHVPGGTWRQLQRHEIPPSMTGLLKEGDWLLVAPYISYPIIYNLEDGTAIDDTSAPPTVIP